MAIVFEDNFQGTAGNAFTGDSFYSVVTGSPIYSSTSHPAVKGVRCPAAAQTVISYAVSGTPTVRTESRICKISGTITATAEIIQFRPASGRGIGLQITNTGKLRIVGPDSTSVATGTVNVPMDGTEFRVRLTENGTAVTAQFWANITDTTAADTISGTASASVAVVTVRDGLQTAGGFGAGITYDVIWPIATDNTTDPGPRSYVFTYDIGLADNVAITDGGSPQELSFLIDMADAVGISEIFDQQAEYSVLLADSVGLADAVNDLINKIFGDSVGLTDDVNTALGNNSANDGADITDSLAVTRQYERLTDDPIDLTDFLAVEKIVNISFTDSVGASDLNTPTLGGNVTVNETVGIVDQLSVVRTILLTFSDSLGIKDTLVWPGSIGATMGSITDIEFVRLRDLGYTGSMSEMRQAWLRDQIVDPQENYYSLRDLEFAYLRSLGYTGSLSDMRSQANTLYKD